MHVRADAVVRLKLVIFSAAGETVYSFLSPNTKSNNGASKGTLDHNWGLISTEVK